MPVYNKRGILLLPKVIVLNPKDGITAVPGEYLEAGQVFGYVAEPTKYYSVEGVNVFFELKHQEKAVDPLDQME